jgi:hypothetical protein
MNLIPVGLLLRGSWKVKQAVVRLQEIIYISTLSTELCMDGPVLMVADNTAISSATRNICTELTEDCSSAVVPTIPPSALFHPQAL